MGGSALPRAFDEAWRRQIEAWRTWHEQYQTRLVAHAEFIKLAHSWAIRRPFDRPQAVWRRYQGKRSVLDAAIWSPKAPVSTITAGQTLRICLPYPATISWRTRDTETQQAETSAAGLGLYFAEIDTRQLTPGQRIRFKLHYHGVAETEGDYTVTLNV